jgi:hypothetical protein
MGLHETRQGASIRLVRDRWFIGVVGVSLLAGSAVLSATVPVAASGHERPAATKAGITSVVITGSVAKPVITVHGHGFGSKPKPDPAYHPLHHRFCELKKPTGKLGRYGFDYGSNNLYLFDTASGRSWEAGRYRPAIGELDCIGVIITKYTASTVRFRLGAVYPHYPSSTKTYHLKRGDPIKVGVNGLAFHGHVAYH